MSKKKIEVTIRTTQNQNDSLLSTKDIWTTFWRCRDFELSHLWQRSILLTTITVLCYGAYGAIVLELCKTVSSSQTIGISIYVLNNIAICLCTVNIVLSCLWIMMGKGSKAWYERYENAISAFERNKRYVSNEVSEIGGFQYQNLDKYDINDSLFSTSGGAFSPSRINIAIGQIALLVWICAILAHICLLFCNFTVTICIVRYGVGVLIILIMSYLLLKLGIFRSSKCFKNQQHEYWIKSKTLENHKKIINQI